MSFNFNILTRSLMIENIKKYGPIHLEDDYVKVIYGVIEDDLYCEWYEKNINGRTDRHQEYEEDLFKLDDIFAVADEEEYLLVNFIKEHWPTTFLLGCL